MDPLAHRVAARFLHAAPKTKLKPGTPEWLRWAEGEMEKIRRNEGLEATNMRDLVEMYAWDLGYQSAKGHRGVSLADWFIALGKHHGVDVKKEFEKGKKDAED